MELRQINAAETLQQLREVSQGIKKEDSAYKESGLTEKAYGVYKIIQVFEEQNQSLAVAEEHKDEYGRSVFTLYLDASLRLASYIDELYSSSDTAPVGWHLKEQMKKELRSKVRKTAYDAGFTDPADLKVLPKKIEEYAMRFYVRAV